MAVWLPVLTLVEGWEGIITNSMTATVGEAVRPVHLWLEWSWWSWWQCWSWRWQWQSRCSQLYEKLYVRVHLLGTGQSTKQKFNDDQDDNDDDNDDHDYDHDNVDHQISLTGQSTPEAFTRNRLVRGWEGKGCSDKFKLIFQIVFSWFYIYTRGEC